MYIALNLDSSLQSQYYRRNPPRKIFLDVNEAFSQSDYGREMNTYQRNTIVYVPVQIKESFTSNSKKYWE